MILETVTFRIPEILSLVGLIQCVYILVYMAFRAGGWKQAALPFVYFLILGLAFFADFAKRFVGDYLAFYNVIEWGLWFAGPPLSVLLMIQIARITEPPPLKNFQVLGYVPAALILATLLTRAVEGSAFNEWLTLTGLLARPIRRTVCG